MCYSPKLQVVACLGKRCNESADWISSTNEYLWSRDRAKFCEANNYAAGITTWVEKPFVL